MDHCSLIERPILKPTAPSKRPLPDRISKNSSENTGSVNAFLPKELAEIIATRQRRERAWHVRFMICATILSNIDSTLANLDEDIEKEEAEAFKAYLRLAISNFAAADFSPTPPRVPIHTRPNKGNGNVKGKEIDRNLTKKVAVATPRIILTQVPSREINKNAELPKLPNLVTTPGLQ
ncbi:putative eka-like protein [Erysiphe necator]|uniref:Putative eka-like protein n=1 Tax=Uncinula necator TaxID=52586 RepID=A0A0B1P2Z9_UNCNE|nr:putative eka-like protein [Erysiphe necator]